MDRSPKVLLRIGILALVLGAAGYAQESAADQPLFELLAAVPAPATDEELENLRVLEYLDIRATEQARGVDRPASWAAFEALSDDRRRLWLAAAQRWARMTPGFLDSFTSFRVETEQAVGFDPFAVDRFVSFGSPPDNAQVLQGSFDAGAIVASFEARGYAAADVPGLDSLLLRRSDGEDDLALDLGSRDLANPFGGPLGRKEPLAILSDSLLVNAPVWELTVALAEAFEGVRPSLLESDDYRAAAEAVVLSPAAPALLIQVTFLAPALFAGAVGTLLTSEFLRSNPGEYSPEEAQLIADAQLVEALEPYLLAVLVDGHHGDEQVAMMALVYPNAERAEAAGQVLEARLANFSSALVDGNEEPIMARVGGHLAETVIHDAGSRAVLVVTARYPAPAPPAAGDRPEASGGLYRQWLRMLLNRAFLPAFFEVAP